jgi:hypothetical protein
MMPVPTTRRVPVLLNEEHSGAAEEDRRSDSEGEAVACVVDEVREGR